MAHDTKTSTLKSNVYVANQVYTYSGGTATDGASSYVILMRKSDGDPLTNTGATLNCAFNYRPTADISVSGQTFGTDVYYSGATNNVNITLTSGVSATSGMIYVYSSTAAKTTTLTVGIYNLASINLYVGYTNTGSVNLGSGTHTFSGNIQRASAGSSSNSLNLGTSATSVAGNIDFTGITVTPGGTVTMNATDTNNTITSASQHFNNLIFSNAAGRWTFQDAVNIDGNLTVTTSETVGNGVDLNGQTTTLTGNFQMDAGKLTTGAASITAEGSWTINGGTQTATGSTVNFTAAATGKTIKSSSQHFNNIAFNNVAGGWALQDATYIDGNFTVTNSDTVGNGVDLNGQTVDINGNVQMDAGKITAGAATISDAGNWTINGGTFAAGSSTVTFNATTGTKTLNGTMTGSSAFNHIVFNDLAGDATFRPTANITINADFTLTDGILDLNTNDPTVLIGNDSGTGNVTFDGGSITNSDSANFILNDNPTEYDDNVGITLGNVVVGQSPAVTNLKSDFSAASLTIATGDRMNTRGWEVTLSTFFDCQGTCIYDTTDTGGANYENNGTITSVGTNWTITSSGTYTLDTDAGTPTKNYFNGTGNQVVTTGDKSFWQFETNNTGSPNDDITISGALDINSTLTITDGELKLDTNDPAVTLAGNVLIASAGSWTKQDDGSTTVTFDGSSTTFTDSSSGGPYDIGLVTIGPGTTTSLSTSSNMKVTNITIGADDTLDISNDTLYVLGNFVNSNTLTATSSTVDFMKASSSQTLNSGGVGAGKMFNNLTHSGAGTLQLVTNAVNIDGVFTNSAGTFDANDLNISVADDFLGAGGTFSADVSPGATTQTVTFDGTNEATVSGNNTFNHLTMNTTTDGAKTIKFTAASTQTINGTWTLDGDAGKVLTLRSTSDNTAWEFVIPADINPAGDFVDVKDSQNNTNAYRITAGANTTDNGNNVPGWIFYVPSLSFSYFSGSSILFDDLNAGNSWTDSAKTTVLRISTNAYNGYVIRARAIDELRSPSSFIAHYVDPNTAPTTWSGTGFGYTTSDTDLYNDSSELYDNRFATGTKFAGWTETGPGDPVADNPNPSHTPITNEDSTITYRVTGNATSAAGQYSTTIVYTCIPQY